MKGMKTGGRKKGTPNKDNPLKQFFEKSLSRLLHATGTAVAVESRISCDTISV